MNWFIVSKDFLMSIYLFIYLFIFKWTYFPFQQIVADDQDAWKNEYIMEEVRKIADNATSHLDHGKCFVYSIFHIFTEVIRVSCFYL